MEQRERGGLLEKLSSAAFNVFGQIFEVTKDEIKECLVSAIFYRSLYDVGFAARHRKDKTLKRTMHDLREILDGRVY